MSSETEIRSFRVDIPDEAIADLRRRIAATRWPSKELVADRSQPTELGWYAGRPASSAGLDPGRLHHVPRRDLPGPRSWVEQGYPTLTYFHEAAKGGHFAAWEEPGLFSEEIRAAFNSLR